MPKAVLIILCAFLVTPLASAEQIFKCAGENGSALYQNFPCQFRSLGAMPVNARADAPPANGSKSPQPRRSPAVGMTHEEVKALWGQAPNAYYGELVEGRVEVWSYSNSRSVTFDVTGHVADVQR